MTDLCKTCGKNPPYELHLMRRSVARGDGILRQIMAGIDARVIGEMIKMDPGTTCWECGCAAAGYATTTA